MTDHPTMLVPTCTLAERAVLPDDPGVALALASALLGDDRKMFNHHRGLWGYTGSARRDSLPLTIQSTGVGTQSATLVLRDLIAAGLKSAIRVGTGLHHGTALIPGDLFAVTEASDGVRTTLLDPRTTESLAINAQGSGPIYSVPFGSAADSLKTADLVTDLETAALAAQAHEHGVRLAAILAIAATGAHALDAAAVAEATERAGIAAGSALTSS